MTIKPCSRTWQVAAAADGRLTGNDLESAKRHRELCAECAAEERRRLELAHTFSALPELGRDPLSSRRARHKLLNEANRSLIEARPEHHSWRWLAALGLMVASVLSYALVPQVNQSPEKLPVKSAVAVRGAVGARYEHHSDAHEDRIDLIDGSASFVVSAHAGRRVIVRLPDGEIEDRGTAFEVAVRGGHTMNIQVTVGRILVTLHDQAPFSLSGGERWERESAPKVPLDHPAESAAPSALAPQGNARATPPPPSVPTAKVNSSKKTAPAAPPDTQASGEPDGATRAEDAAYLSIVALLRQGRTKEARTQCRAYLMSFPNGFRRVEVLNIATSSDAN